MYYVPHFINLKLRYGLHITYIYSTLKNAFQLESIIIKAKVITIESSVVITLAFLEPYLKGNLDTCIFKKMITNFNINLHFFRVQPP